MNNGQKNVAYFKVSLQSPISPILMQYSLTDKKDILYSDAQLIDESTWKPCFVKGGRDLYHYIYYLQIFKFPSNDKNNLAILRIPTYGYTGEITVENLLSL